MKALGLVLLLLASGEPSLEDAYRLIEAGEHAAAVETLAAWLRAHPDDHPRRAAMLAQQGYVLNDLGRLREAQVAFEQALELAPDQADWWRAVGYLALARHDDRTAERAFAQALALDPHQGVIAAQLGYMAKAEGRHRAAAGYFRQAQEDPDLTATDREQYRSEVALAEQTWDIAGFLFLRPADSASAPGLPATLQPLGGSQAGAIARYRPALPHRADRPVTLRARSFFGLAGDRAATAADGGQVGLGIQLKPFETINVTFTTERLIAVGDAARNDWLFTLAGSLSRGLAPPMGKRFWAFGSAYADVSLIGLDERDLFISGEGFGGVGWRLGPQLSLRAEGFVAGLLQDDRFATQSLIEAGPRLRLILPLNDTHKRAFRSRLELALAYRGRLRGDGTVPAGVSLRVGIRY